jgi:glycerol kinase
VEHDPLELLASIEACLAAVGTVDAIGLANQGESCLAWDAVSGEPLSPVIVWQDNRTEAAVARLRAAGLEAEVRHRAGLPLDSYFSASKLAWLLENVPAVAAARRAGRLRLGTTDSFFLHRLTGAAATDVTTASRTSLMNLADRRWDAVLCDAFGVPAECLPPILATDAGFGRVGAAPLVASVVDQQAALYGHGCRNPGDAKITFGTGASPLPCMTGASPPPTASSRRSPGSAAAKCAMRWRAASTTSAPLSNGRCASAWSTIPPSSTPSPAPLPSRAALPSFRPFPASPVRNGTGRPSACSSA